MCSKFGSLIIQMVIKELKDSVEKKNIIRADAECSRQTSLGLLYSMMKKYKLNICWPVDNGYNSILWSELKPFDILHIGPHK